ncbi:MAG: NAD(P)-binding domain-containing protein, partial [Clostridia bacterium]|nr:NAD(P)-binding domain-containing protein [Clostridia bacterium]
MSIKIGIFGYGNLGRGIESAIKMNNDLELVAVFTRRNPKDLKTNTENAKVCSAEDILEYKDKIDVLILCGGSATDLPVQT